MQADWAEAIYTLCYAARKNLKRSVGGTWRIMAGTSGRMADYGGKISVQSESFLRGCSNCKKWGVAKV